MKNQYCKVGSTTPITSGSHAVAILEYRYQNFMEMATNEENIDAKLVEFFESKALQIKRILEDLIQ